MIQRMEETGKDLTYTIQVSTNGSSGWITKGTTYGKSGSSISITASGLSQITSYYWKVIVTDTGGLSVDTGTNSAITTMCSGTGATCSYMRNDCAYCNGWGLQSVSGETIDPLSQPTFANYDSYTSGLCDLCGKDAMYSNALTAKGTVGNYTTFSAPLALCSTCRGLRPSKTQVLTWIATIPKFTNGSNTLGFWKCKKCNGKGGKEVCTHGFESGYSHCNHGGRSPHEV